MPYDPPQSRLSSTNPFVGDIMDGYCLQTVIYHLGNFLSYLIIQTTPVSGYSPILVSAIRNTVKSA